MKRTLPALLAVIMVSISGCALFGKDTVKPSFPTEGKKIAIVPFAFGGEDFFESKLGIKMAREVQNLVQSKSSDLTFVSPEPLAEILMEHNVEDIDWNEAGRVLKADYVLLGIIRTFTLKDPKVIGLLRGNVEVEIKLFDVVHGGKVILAKPVQHKYPPGEYEATAGEENEESVEKFLFSGIVNKIAGHFYAYPKESE
jgi:hypothetical protein